MRWRVFTKYDVRFIRRVEKMCAQRALTWFASFFVLPWVENSSFNESNTESNTESMMTHAAVHCIWNAWACVKKASPQQFRKYQVFNTLYRGEVVGSWRRHKDEMRIIQGCVVVTVLRRWTKIVYRWFEKWLRLKKKTSLLRFSRGLSSVAAISVHLVSKFCGECIRISTMNVSRIQWTVFGLTLGWTLAFSWTIP